MAKLVRHAMTPSPQTAGPDMTASDAAARELMAEHRVRRLPVVKGDELVGIVSLGDVAVQESSKRAVGEALEDLSESESTTHLTPGPDLGTPDRVRGARTARGTRAER